MTCYYETLRDPTPALDAPMAHHFVKWWRNKFRNGYKKFSIDMEGERTDTEELVGRAASQCSAPPDLLPCDVRARLQPPPSPRPRAEPASKPPPVPAPASPPQGSPPEQRNDTHHRLRFEELTCDVELQHPEPSKQQPLQFSFTLYDLDGHGRMTKDDIAGIVSTIYEAIGKSVTVPHYGSKTIKVRLTVMPEDSSRGKREVGKRRRESTRMPTTHECGELSEEEHRDPSGDDFSSKSSCSVDRRPTRRPPPAPLPRPHSHRHPRREKRERKYTKKRSGSLQRRELLEIIQANMEKNHRSFQASRKPSDPVVNEDEITTKYQKIRNRSHTVSEKPLNAFQKHKSEISGNGYLDLASGDSNLCRYDRYLHAVICSSARHAHTGYHQQPTVAPSPRTPRASHQHHRSRSHDLPTQLSQAHQPRVLQIIFL